MSNENKGSLMDFILKSTVGKMAILASTAVAMSSCTTTSYSNSLGYSEVTQSSGISAGQVLQGIAIVGDIATNNHAISKTVNYRRYCVPAYRPSSSNSCYRPRQAYVRPVGHAGHHPCCTGRHQGSYCITR
ncbi:MAG: hypothetical protein IKV03_00830 [Alphaproteobacteria bacterium]|nr:hypothetical protein [Alphaproteobacteria bacterium]